ncbi:MAG: hypothetical protein JXI43_10355 [Tissierellales bacterium]|nr:hypothetical protein [Tissierellales bacterium]
MKFSIFLIIFLTTGTCFTASTSLWNNQIRSNIMIENFTNLIITKLVNVEVPHSKENYFYVTVSTYSQSLSQAKASLLFQNLKTGKYIPNPIELEYIAEGEFKSKEMIDLSSELYKNSLALVRFEYDGQTFYSNHVRPYSPDTTQVLPFSEVWTDSLILRTLKLLEIPLDDTSDAIADIIGEIARRIKTFGLDGKFKIYKVAEILDQEPAFLQYAVRKFSETYDGKPLLSVVTHIEDALADYSKTGNANISFIFRGTASDTKLNNPTDLPSFTNERLFTWSSTGGSEYLIEETFTCNSLRYSNEDLPKLRALEVRKIAIRRLERKYPDIENRIFAVYTRPYGSELPENRRIDIFLIVSPKEIIIEP